MRGAIHAITHNPPALEYVSIRQVMAEVVTWYQLFVHQNDVLLF